MDISSESNLPQRDSLKVLRAVRNCDKQKLNEWFYDKTGHKLSMMVIILYVILLDRSSPTRTRDLTKPNSILNRNYTSDVMGEWIDRQATTVRVYLKILRQLGWIDTVQDLELHRGWIRFEFYSERAIAFLNGLGKADMKQIKSSRRSKSQKENIDTRKYRKADAKALPTSWITFAKNRAANPDELAAWTGVLQKLFRDKITLNVIEMVAHEERDEHLDPFEFAQVVRKNAPEYAQRIKESSEFLNNPEP